MAETQLNVTGMTCNHCVQTVQKTLASLSGVQKVDVQLVPPKAIITHENIFDLEAAIKAIEKEGYKAIIYS